MAQSIQIPVEVLLDVNSNGMKSAQKQIGGVLKSTKSFSSADFFSPITKSAGKMSSVLEGIKTKVGVLSSSFDRLKSVAMSAIGVTALVALGKKVADLSSSLIEIQNVVDTTFGSMASDVNDFANTALKSFGLTEMQAKKYSSTLGATMKSQGIAGDELVKMSVNLTKLTGDLASFYNMDHDEVYEKLRSGMTGNVKAMQGLGVTMTITNLQAYALSQGINKTWREMTQAEKAALRYNYILANTSDSQGDFTKTALTWANQIRILQSGFAQLGSIIGGLVQKTLYPFIVALNNIISLAISGVSALAKMMGFDVSGIQAQQGVGSGGVDLSDSINEADAMDDLASSTDGASKAQDKLNKSQQKGLSNLHELNVLSKNSSADSGSGRAGSVGASPSGLSFGLLDYVTIKESDSTNPFKDLAEKVKAVISEDDWEGVGALFASKINGAFANKDFSGVSEQLSGFISDIARTINGFLGELDTNGIGSSIGSFLNTIVTAIDTWFSTVDFKLFGTKLAGLINGSLASFDGVEFGKTISHWFNAMFDWVVGFVSTLDWEGIGLEIADAINGFFEDLDAKDVADAINKLIDGIVTTLSTAINNTDWDAIWNKIFEFWDNLDTDSKFAVLIAGTVLLAPKIAGLLKVFSSLGKIVAPVLDFFGSLGEVIALVAGGAGTLSEAMTAIFGGVATVIAGIGAVAVGAFTAISNFIDMLVNGFSWLKEVFMVLGIAIAGVGAVILGVPAAIAGVVAAIVAGVATAVVVIVENWNAIVEFFAGVISAIGEFFVGLWTGITEVFASVATFFTDTFTLAFEGISTAFSTIGDFFSGIWEGIQSIFSTVVGFFTDIFNGAINGIKTAFSAIGEFFSGIWTAISSVFNNVVSFFTDIFKGAVDGIKGLFSGLGSFFSGVWNSIVSIFSTIGTAISDAITGAVKGAINALLGGAAFIINGFISAINTAISVINAIPGVSIDKLSKIEVPKLANGAVIPPNQEFLAILGDQKRGTNIETPLSTMLQAFRTALDSYQGGGGLGDGNIIIPIYVNDELSAEQVIRLQDIEQYRNNGK